MLGPWLYVLLFGTGPFSVEVYGGFFTLGRFIQLIEIVFFSRDNGEGSAIITLIK